MTTGTNSNPAGRRVNAALALLTAVSLSLAGCGGDSTNFSAGNGQALISLTDAPGDFLAYSVDVASLTLTKQGGTVVSTLPRTARVDFAQLANLGELLTGASVPAGEYTRVVMHLDYSNADIEVDKGDGTGVKATVQDSGGNPVTTLDVSLDFDTNRPLVIVPGLPSQLELDFNLAASNDVDMTDPANPVVAVDPVLTASLSFDQTRLHRVRGPLAGVNTSAGTFSLFLRPFHLLQGDFGQIDITTDANTIFEIDQTAYQGSVGLAQLAAEPVATATVAVVEPDGAGHLVASEVYAGSSVAFGTRDVVTGNVTSRSGDVLTVRGASLVRADGTLSFHDTLQVQLGPSTKVTAQSSITTGLNKDNISVGQRITAFGIWDVIGSALDSTDPSNGPVRMLLTQLNGNINTVSNQVVDMNLNRIDGRPITIFDFTGAGSSGHVVDPSHYMVNIPNSINPPTGNGAALKVRGFVAPFGQATATDDFDASTLINVSTGPADLVVHWPITALVTTPFITFNTSGMVVDLSQSTLVHDVYRSGVDTTLLTTDTPSVNAITPNLGLFVIGYHGAIQVYLRLSDFQSALQARLGAGQYARVFAAHGIYTDTSETMTATGMLVLLR